MPSHIRRHALQQFFEQAEPAGSGSGSNPPIIRVDTPSAEELHLGDAGKAALDAERAARREADKRARDVEKELADLKAAAAKREEAEQAEQGRWKELAEKREAELTSTATDRDSLKGERDALAAFFQGQFDAAIKDLPDVLTAFKPADDASFAEKSAWLTKAQEQAKKLEKDNASAGNGPNPKPASGKFDLEAAVAKAKSTGRYRV